MARRGRRSDRDDAHAISNDPLARELRSPLIKKILEPVTRPSILAIEDRRLFSPELARPARALPRAAARLTVHDPNVNRTNKKIRTNKLHVPSDVRFSDPTRVAICVRRHQRREVLHALRYAGSGAGRRKLKRPRWSEFSDIKC